MAAELKKCTQNLSGVTTDNMLELSYEARKRIHNLKYFTWVEQQGRTYDEIQAQWYDPCYWTDVQNQVEEVDELITEFNKKVGLSK
jgi:cysteine synthase A